MFNKGFRRYAAIPLLVNIVLFSALGALLFNNLGPWVDGVLPPGGWHDYLRWLAWPLAVIAFLLVGYFGFAVVGNVIAAPFSELLAARIVATARNDRPIAGPRALTWRGAAKSVGDELLKLWHIASRSLPALLLFPIPGLNLVAPVIWFLVGSWLLALEYLEYPFAESGMGFNEQRRRLRHDRLTTVAFGAGVATLLVIPILNLAAIPASVAGASLLWKERWADSGPADTGPR